MNFRGCGGTCQNLSFGTDFRAAWNLVKASMRGDFLPVLKRRGKLSKVDISRRCALSEVDTFGSGIARTVDVYFHPGALAY